MNHRFFCKDNQINGFKTPPNKEAHNSEEFSFNNAKRLEYNDLLLHEFIANLDIDPELPQIQQAWQKTRTFGIMHT